MTNEPYQTPDSELVNPDDKSSTGFKNYSEVPWYRRQWFFWISYFIAAPIALAILAFGDIYYVKKGKVVSFGIANRIVAGIIGVLYLLQIISMVTAI